MIKDGKLNNSPIRFMLKVRRFPESGQNCLCSESVLKEGKEY